MESIYDVARYFLSKEGMDHKKLQKLCYYAQAWYLANNNHPLVPNRFEAWIHGPVSPDLYHQYSDWGWVPIPRCDERVSFENSEVSKFLDLVYDTYGDYTGNELESITHKEQPWIKARNGCGPYTYSRNPISLVDMKKYYGERIGKTYD